MKENIVILGAGFGGLRAAMLLGRAVKREKLKNSDVILIDENDYHTFTPTLYEISTTPKEAGNYMDLKSVNTFPVENILKKLPVKFINSEAVKIDTAERSVHLKDGRHIPYGKLIIAIGSEANFFGIKEAETKALKLKSFKDAIKIRDTVWDTICGASPSDSVNIIIGGAGPTGVELTGEIQKWIAQLKEEGYNCKTTTTLISGSRRILNRFDRRIGENGEKRLKKLGANITTGMINEIVGSRVYLDGGETLKFDVLIWTGGVKGNSLSKTASLKTDESGRIVAGDDLSCIFENAEVNNENKVFAIGDAASITDKRTGKPVPGAARAAISQASVVAKNIIHGGKGKSKKTFRPRNYPYVVPIGGKYSIVKIGPFVISGLVGWLFKGLIELNYLASIMPLREAFAVWLKGLKIFIQNDRLG